MHNELLPITRQQNFRLVQIEKDYRKHFKVHLKISAIKGRKHCDKRRKCLLQAISPFLTMFSTAIYLYCLIVWVKYTHLKQHHIRLRPGHTTQTLLERSLNGRKGRGRISTTLVIAHKMGKK